MCGYIFASNRPGRQVMSKCSSYAPAEFTRRSFQARRRRRATVRTRWSQLSLNGWVRTPSLVSLRSCTVTGMPSNASNSSHTTEESLSTGRDCKREANVDKSPAGLVLPDVPTLPSSAEGTGGNADGGGKEVGGGGAENPALLMRAKYAGSRFSFWMSDGLTLSAAQASMSSATSPSKPLVTT
eukprot:UN0863